MTDILIIGGGACGLLSSILLAQKGKTVTLLEQNSSFAKKLRVSGNGRCNITNKSISEKSYHTNYHELLKNVLKNFTYHDSKKLFSSLGIEFFESEDGRVFPLSLDAKSVVDILTLQAENAGVKLELNTKVLDVSKTKEFTVMTDKQTFKAKKLVVCSGSFAYEKIGVSSVGYDIAKKFGHSLLDMFASLVQVECEDKFVQKASGVKVDSQVKLLVDGKVLKEVRGDLLFTNYGLSGLAILDISYFVAKYHDKKLSLSVDLMPEFSQQELKALLQKRLKLKDSLDFDSWLGSIINKKLIPLVATTKTLNNKTINQLSHNIKNLTITPKRVRDAKYAEIIAGGVDATEVDSKTLESKNCKGLYFGGEVLSVAGSRGGYNLHFAFGCAKKLASTF